MQIMSGYLNPSNKILIKSLYTLEIPDYVDDRGFATSTETKLLPDELRVYEAR